MTVMTPIDAYAAHSLGAALEALDKLYIDSGVTFKGVLTLPCVDDTIDQPTAYVHWDDNFSAHITSVVEETS